MVGPEYFVAKVGDVETYFTHTINFRERVPPIVELFYGCVPEVIKLWFKVRGTFVPFVCFIIVTANVAMCHYPISRNLFIAISPAIFSASA